ncbi:hypothetical protein B0T10DRAFT_573249 [Thelonectria olida]|uniref:Uncharacterized protein n=1 Tax=Thelonectria olida TaxID=1576542 RepID=A0A9P9ANR7_9HYPO|nr:hypothetical protein B0T10DRAFT_573249 [Thelonectria olida]
MPNGKLRTKLNLLTMRGDKDGTASMFQLIRYRSTAPPTAASPKFPLLLHPSPTQEENLISRLGVALCTCPEGFQLRYLGSYMLDVPARLGHNPALDTAVECLLQSHSQLLRVRSSPSGRVPTDSKYSKALRALQGAIVDPTLAMSAETACAAILMCRYEMMMPEARGAQYVTHAQGACNLILLRGPGAISTEFERGLLRAQTGQLVLNAFFWGEDCVLLQDSWQHVTRGKQKTFKVTKLDQLFETVYHIPSLVKQISDFKNGKSVMNMDQLTSYAKRLQEELVSLSATEATSSKATEGTDQDLGYDQILLWADDDIFPIVLSFHSREGAVFHSWVWMASLMVDMCMDNLVPDPRLRDSMSEAARRICMCYEYVSLLKPIGALYLQLQLTAAYYVSDQRQRDWIVEKVNIIMEDLHIHFSSSYFETIGSLLFKGLS